MNKCINKWTTNLSSLNNAEFEELLRHTEDCTFHAGILDKYEADVMPFVELAFSGILARPLRRTPFANQIADVSGMSFHNYEGTSVTLVPKRYQPRNRTAEEESISEEIKNILSTGITPDNCGMCLKFLEKKDRVVQYSWSHKLNKARVLRGLGEKRKASDLVDLVMESYSADAARGTAFEVRSWFDELEYNEGGKVNKQILYRRTNNIKKGLHYSPENFILRISAFEAACLRGCSAEAIIYLRNVERFDSKLAREYFHNCPIRDEITRSDRSLVKEIIRLFPSVKKEYSLVN